MPVSGRKRLGPHELPGLLGAEDMGVVYLNLRCVQEAFARWSAGESYARSLDINAKADPGAPLVDEARRSFGVGRADARVSTVGVGSPQR